MKNEQIKKLMAIWIHIIAIFIIGFSLILIEYRKYDKFRAFLEQRDETEMEKVIIILHSKYKDRQDAQVKYLDQFVGQSVLCGHGRYVKFHRILYFKFLCKQCIGQELNVTSSLERTTKMLQHARDTTSGAWYFKMDDDSFLYWKQLLLSICTLDYRDHFFGGFLMYADGIRFASGGAGYLLSEKSIRYINLTSCGHHQYEDVGIAICFKKHGILVQKLEGVNPDTPEKMIEWSNKPSYDHVRPVHLTQTPITYHYIPRYRIPLMEWSSSRIIPKILHFIWLSNKNPPTQWLRSCVLLHPDWDIRVWTYNTLKTLTWDSKYQTNGSFTMKYKFLSGLRLIDIIKLEVLYRFGGIFLDIDAECLRKLNPLLDYAKTHEFVGIYEHNHNNSWVKGLVANGILIAVQYSQAVYYALGKIRYISNGPAWLTTGPCFVTKHIIHANLCNETAYNISRKICAADFKPPFICKQNKLNVTVLDSDSFLPYHHSEGNLIKSCASNIQNAFQIHYWGSTHNIYKAGQESLEDLLNQHGKVWYLDSSTAITRGQWIQKCGFNGKKYLTSVGFGTVKFGINVHRAIRIKFFNRDLSKRSDNIKVCNVNDICDSYSPLKNYRSTKSLTITGYNIEIPTVEIKKEENKIN